MPRDLVHNVAGLALLVMCIKFMANKGVEEGFIAVFSLSYLFSLFWFSPDLDLDRGSASLHRWGPLRFIWYPYKAIFSHRGISHNLFLGPLTRVVYFGLIILVLLRALEMGLALPPLKSDTVAAIAIGLLVPDTLHCLLDFVVTKPK